MIGKTTTSLLLLATVLIVSIWFWQSAQKQLDHPAPKVEFKTLQGRSIELFDLIGKPVLLTFWATDCKSCLEEIPDLVQLHQQFSSDGLTIIAVAMSYDPPNRVLTMTQVKSLPYEVALDPSGSIAQAFGNVKLTPTTFLIDGTGKIVLHHVGKFDLADMTQRIAGL
jgi:peroxiredoxin